MSSIINAKLDWNSNGTPVSEQFDDVYFSNVNGLEESRYVFLSQNHLPQRWHSYEGRRFVIAETGFGTGLNFLATWQWFEQFSQHNPNAALQELHFISFEKFPLNLDDLEKAHHAWPELEPYAKQLRQYYPIAVTGCHRIVLADGAITLDLWFGDISECLPMVPTGKNGIVDAWYLDGFAPSKNPEMWVQPLFDGMANIAKQGCSCATFTATGFVRRGLIEAGFEMKKVAGFGTKREMLAGNLKTKKPQSNIKPWFARPASNQIEDVAIIGGGIASACLALCLSRRGLKVTIYCKDSSGAQNASGNRQGALYPLLHGDHTVASRLFAPAFLFARQFIQQTSDDIQFDFDWCGVTQLDWSEKSAQQNRAILAGNFPQQLVHPLSPTQTEIQIGLPTDISSIHYPLGGWICPQQFTQNLLSFLEKEYKANVQFNSEVTQLEWYPDDQLWQLEIVSCQQNEKHGDIKHSQHQAVVIANGHNFAQLEQTQQIPASSVKGQVSHIPTTDTLKQLKSVLCYNGYMTPHNPSDQLHCIGASHDRKQIDQKFDIQAQEDNRYKLLRSLPKQDWPNEVDISDNLARQGIRCVTRDHLPFVGNVCNYKAVLTNYANLNKEQDVADEVSSYPSLYCLLALGSRGLCSAPLMAETLASQICNDPLPLSVECLENIHPAKMWVRKLLKGRPVTTR